jgi:hypothetical protein
MAVPSVASAGDPDMVPLSSLQPVVVPHGTLVLGESMKEALQALMLLVREVSGTDGA